MKRALKRFWGLGGYSLKLTWEDIVRVKQDIIKNGFQIKETKHEEDEFGDPVDRSIDIKGNAKRIVFQIKVTCKS